MLERFAFEDLDVAGKTDVEATNAFHATDISGEVPNVLIVFVSCDEILGSGKFLDKKVLGHEVELQRDLGCGVGIHMEHVNTHLLVAGGSTPRFVFENLNITDAIEVEDASGLSVEIITDDEIVLGAYIIGLDVAVADGAPVVGCILVENDTAFKSACMLQRRYGCCQIFVGEKFLIDEFLTHFFGHDSRFGIDTKICDAFEFD